MPHPRPRTRPPRFRLPFAAALLAALLAGTGAAGAHEAAVEPVPTEDGMPVIESGDDSVGAIVLDGPTEPAAALPEHFLPEEMLAPDGVAIPGGPPVPEAPPPAGPIIDAAGALSFIDAPPAAAPHPSAAAVPVPGPADTPVVVELFTAQGCSSCPPADGLLAALAGRPDVLPLSFHVDYWDYLGWADTFARPEFTARQRGYAARSGERAVWTPQIIVGGTDTLIDITPPALERLIDDARGRRGAVALSVGHEGDRMRVEIAPARGRSGPASLELVRYLPRREVVVEAGENRGRRLDYRNVVVGVERLARWDGRQPLRLTIRPGGQASSALPADTRHALVLQSLERGRPGAILAAVPLD